MLLIDPAQAASAIQASCNGAGAASNDSLILVLKYITPRVEDAMNVAFLARGAFVDSFYLTAMNSRCRTHQVARLRLSNGYLVDGQPVTVLDADGNDVSTDIELVDEKLGVVELNTWKRGRYTVAYTSGFEVPADPDPVPDGFDPDSKVLVGVETWIQALCSALVVEWYRSTLLAPKLPQNVNLSALDQMLRKEIYVRVYGRYLRPRYGCFFSEKLTNGA